MVAAALAFLLFSSVSASSGGYYTFTGKGSSMYPTIAEGDRITVQFCMNGTLVDVGDIIAYSTIVTGLDTGYMLICHRVIEKYEKDDTWYFKTQGDNCPEPDFYEVPEYWLFGIVVDIEHTDNSNVHTETLSQTGHPLLQGPQTALLGAGVLCVITAAAVLSRRRNKQKALLKNANIYSCYTCKHYEMQYVYRLTTTDGRIGIRKVPDFSRGYCQYLNHYVLDLSRWSCKGYEPKNHA